MHTDMTDIVAAAEGVSFMNVPILPPAASLTRGGFRGPGTARSAFRQLWLLLLLLAVASVMAQGVDQLAAASQRDLDTALLELSKVQKQIGDERIPLSRRLNELEGRLVEMRREVEKAQRFQENQLVELNALKTEVNRARDSGKFLNSLLGEYEQRFETRIHIAEVERYRTVVAEAKGAAGNGNLSPAERFEAQAALLETSLDRLEALVGGDAFEGRALTPAGVMESGRYLVVGPSAFFASTESPSVGAVQLQLGSPEPAIIPLTGQENTGLRSLIESGSGELPVDATMGNALKFQATKDSFITHLSKGGPVMVPILLLGVLSAIIFLVRWVVVGRVRVASPKDLQAILDSIARRDDAGAAARAKSIAGPVGAMLNEAIRHCRERKEYVEEVMYERMLVAKPELEKLLPFLALSAAAAPLLGLLGTVTGMINTFNAITVLGAGDPKTLAGGISEALITTEFGLIVAIPSLLLHAILSRKVKGILGGMEQTATGFINGLPGQSDETIHFKKA